MPSDLTSTLDRIASHIPCLEAMAADTTTPALVRAVVRVDLEAFRLARDLYTADLKEADRGN